MFRKVVVFICCVVLVSKNDISSEMKTLLSYMSDLESEDIDIISYNNWLRINF